MAPGFAQRPLLKLLSFKIYYFGFARASFKAYRVSAAKNISLESALVKFAAVSLGKIKFDLI